MIIKMYLHGSKEENYKTGEELGLSDDICKVFQYALYEVEFDVELDVDTGKTTIIAIDGRKVGSLTE